MVQWGNNNIGLNRKSLHNIVFVHATVASVILSTSLQCLIQSLQTTTFHHPSLQRCADYKNNLHYTLLDLC